MVPTILQVDVKKLFKTRMLQKKQVRRIISKKLDFEIRKIKEELEKEFKKQTGYKRKVSYALVSDIVGEILRRKRYKNG